MATGFMIPTRSQQRRVTPLKLFYEVAGNVNWRAVEVASDEG